ncbi:hypothetical protein EPI10_015836 [Gossypium australe]|uniref:Uncharacterized protein n=1 Tax=Gossypium australe TaxID=47621 RepID=A0A5B6VLK2_9ROSI|nr:hypothetical protein EPI10_015836 [Gossypium australe]
MATTESSAARNPQSWGSPARLKQREANWAEAHTEADWAEALFGNNLGLSPINMIMQTKYATQSKNPSATHHPY